MVTRTHLSMFKLYNIKLELCTCLMQLPMLPACSSGPADKVYDALTKAGHEGPGQARWLQAGADM
jgi:hypothetical protein